MSRIENNPKMTPIQPTHQTEKYGNKQYPVVVKNSSKAQSATCVCNWCGRVFKSLELTDLKYMIASNPHSKMERTAKICASCRKKVQKMIMEDNRDEVIDRLENPIY